MTSRRSAKTRLPQQKSHSVAESADPRVEKTRALISAAFVALVRRRPYYRIRVSDITRKAGVGRATFYAHFESKDALLQAQFVGVVRLMVVELPDDPCLVDCTVLFAHIQHAGEIYRSLSAGPGRVVTDTIVQDALESRIAAVLAARATRSSGAAPTPGFVPRFVAGTVLALIAWSLEQSPAPSPIELQATYRELVGRALERGESSVL
jgi:AcrR family transcriptional regulator